MQLIFDCGAVRRIGLAVCLPIGLFAAAANAQGPAAEPVIAVASVPAGSRALLEREELRALSLTLVDCDGKRRSLSEHQDSKFVVLLFVGAECPLAQLYWRTVEQLNGAYADKSVVFVAIDCFPADTPQKVQAVARQLQVTIPILMDSNQELAKAFKPERVPEAIVLDETRRIRYQGIIDSEYGFGQGCCKKPPVIPYLSDALNELLAGKDVSLALKPGPGCVLDPPLQPGNRPSESRLRDKAPPGDAR